MKIALVSTSTYPAPPRAYGGEVQVWLLARELGEMGHEVELFAPGGSKVPPSGRLHYTRGSYGHSNAAFECDAWDLYREVIESCDVVSDWSHSGMVMEQLWMEDPLKPAIHTYNGVTWNHPRMHRHNAVVPSESVREAALAGRGAWEGVEGVKVSEDYPGQLFGCKVVHWGVDTGFYTPDREEEVKIGGLEPLEPGYLLYVGRPHPAKGVNLLGLLAARLPQERFVFAWRASHPDHRKWEQDYLERAQGLPNLTILQLPEVGHHEAKRALYRNAKAFLSPALYLEAFGMTGVEAMACGTPAILGSNGAGPEIMVRPEMGALVDAHQGVEQALVQLEEAIVRIPDYDGAVAREEVVNRFDMKLIAKQYVSLYAAVLAGDTW